MDVCSYLNGTENPILQWFLDFFSAGIPQNLIHPCPYIGVFNVYNLTIDNELTTKFPAGQYLITTKWFDDLDDNIVSTRQLGDNLVGKAKPIKNNKKSKRA